MKPVFVNHFPAVIVQDMIGLLLGEIIGKGHYREVWSCRLDPSLVVKVEVFDDAEFCNVQELQVWTEVKSNKRLARWFAPAVNISPCGTVLLQKRCEPVCENFKLPKSVPSFLADVHYRNWGIYEGKPVMMDYGNHAFYSLGIKHHKMVPPIQC